MKSAFQRLAIAGVLCLGLAVSAAAAQDRPAARGAPGEALGQGGADRQQLFEDMQHRRERRLHDLLQIKPGQEAAFGAFVSSLEQLRPERGARRGGEPGVRGQPMPLPAPERLDRAVQRLSERQQRLQKADAAVKIFYAALTPSQRKVFDEFGPLGGHGRRGGGMWLRSRFDRPGGDPPGR